MEEFAQTTTDYIQQNQRLNQAIIFAAQCHAGQLRKGTTLPYILHPLETMQILSVMQADTNLLIAGLLHDVLEDTDTTAEQITQQFGPEVLALVQEHSENKADSWLNRKLRAIQMLEQADLPQKMLALADKLSNLLQHCPEIIRLWAMNFGSGFMRQKKNRHGTTTAFSMHWLLCRT